MTTVEETTGGSPGVGRAFLDVARRQLAERADRIGHCVGQLDDAQLWWRPQESINSIANILLHVCGNLRQWIVSGVGGEPDVRDRPGEFSERRAIPRAELVGRFQAMVAQVDAVLAEFDEGRLLQPRRIQGFDETPLSATWHSLEHLGGHTQEIIYITRLQLGDRYRFAWTPASPEEGAPI
jgi:Protein of unknown function (DUF1572)